MTTTFRVGSATDTGRVRQANQDSLLVSEPRSLFVVADGMGGHQGGEVASAMAVEILGQSTVGPSQDALVAVVEEANRTIHARASDDPDLRGMGTTLCAVALVETDDGDEEVAWINVGDSRIYLFRDDALLQLSTDHSLVEDLRRDGQLTDEQAAAHPQRNIITRALGIDADVEVDSRTVIPFTGDRFLLCSDGLFGEVNEDRIAATLRRLADPGEAASELVRQANEAGGRDNITVVLVDVIDDGGRSAAASAAIAAASSGLASSSEDPTVDLAGFSTPMSEPVATPGPAADEDALPFGRETADVFGDLDKARGRHLTWRVVAFVVCILAVVAIALGAIGWFAKRTYYVAFAGDRVAVYQGQPGGLLIFDPTVKLRTDLTRARLTDAEQQAVANEATFSSYENARSFVNNLETRVTAREDAPPSTTTTTRPKSTTTTTRPAPKTTTTTTTRPASPTTAPPTTTR